METNEVLFKNTSKMDHEEISIFQNSIMKKSTTIWTMIIFVLVFAGIGVGLAFVDLTFGIIIIVCGALGGFVFLPYLMKENMKKVNKETLGDKKYLNTFEFYADYAQITTQASKLNENQYEEVGSQKLYYKDIYQVTVYKERLFIFLNPRQSFIFNFKGMTKGTAGEVVELLKANNVKVKDNSLKG